MVFLLLKKVKCFSHVSTEVINSWNETLITNPLWDEGDWTSRGGEYLHSKTWEEQV